MKDLDLDLDLDLACRPGFPGLGCATASRTWLLWISPHWDSRIPVFRSGDATSPKTLNPKTRTQLRADPRWRPLTPSPPPRPHTLQPASSPPHTTYM